MQNRFLLILLIFVCSSKLFAQIYDRNSYYPDTLSSSEQRELDSAYRLTSMSYFYLIDSLSKAGDSVGASNYFLKLNPYQLFAEQLPPDSVDNFISKYKYRITTAARKEFLTRYVPAYYAPKSAAYYRFKQMGDEDQQIRHSFDNATQQSFAKLVMDVAQPTDSIHFDYLYNYVKKNGWPKLEDGSLPASIIAIHDHARHSFYLPLLKKAVMKGQTDASFYAQMYNWNAHSHDRAMDVQEYIGRGKFIRFDISELLEQQPVAAATKNSIRYAIRKHYPVKALFLIECHDEQKSDAYWMQEIQHWHNNNGRLSVISYFIQEFADDNCKLSKQELFEWTTGMYRHDWLPSERIEPKLYF